MVTDPLTSVIETIRIDGFKIICFKVGNQLHTTILSKGPLQIDSLYSVEHLSEQIFSFIENKFRNIFQRDYKTNYARVVKKAYPTDTIFDLKSIIIVYE